MYVPAKSLLPPSGELRSGFPGDPPGPHLLITGWVQKGKEERCQGGEVSAYRQCGERIWIAAQSHLLS